MHELVWGSKIKKLRHSLTRYYLAGSMDIFKDRKSKKSKGIKYSLLKQNMDGITGQVWPLDGDDGDNLRLLTASCLCLLALHLLFCHVCVVTGPVAHVCTVSPLALHRWNIFLEVTDSSMPSCCLLPWKYAFSRLTVKWRHSWGMGSGDVPLYCSVVNKKFCIPALSCYFCSSLKKIITSTELLQQTSNAQELFSLNSFYIAGAGLNLLSFLSVCLAPKPVVLLPFSCRACSPPVPWFWIFFSFSDFSSSCSARDTFVGMRLK